MALQINLANVSELLLAVDEVLAWAQDEVGKPGAERYGTIPADWARVRGALPRIVNNERSNGEPS